ncbi:TonB-dependent receptor [Flavobacteriaceae bacterium F89]|uniref:TonB-dependent receptor n=1 Tax=Cerina litoralis TaxID=2874477 RepID=A0AAE3F038_9FLAO|nr:TonB-dependent receptor [Cerina litoralis]MCG2462816.1 TonB-dependent receptor [Cerina litoralis]
MRILLVALGFLFSIRLMAQGPSNTNIVPRSEPGSIVGKLTDREMNNQPLPFANILIKGTTKGTTSDFDGLYEIPALTPGTYTIVFSFLGYETVEIPNVQVVAGKVTNVDVPMAANEGVSLDEVVVAVTARKDYETALLLEQKKAVAMKTAISAQELSRKGVSDAETAVTKVSGVSKQEGVKNVFVRGLGDRYNTTSLNGLPLPSDDPEYKNISLAIFDANIINSVDINKTFDAGLNGNLGGANINIISKELSSRKELSFGIKTGLNTQTFDKDFLTIDGTNFFGYKGDKTSPIQGTDTYSFENSWDPLTQNLQLNSGINIGAGQKFLIGKDKNSSLSAYLYGSFDNKYNYREGNIKQANAQGYLGKDLDYDQYDVHLSKIGMGNFKYSFGSKNSVSYHTMVVNTTNEALSDFDGLSVGIVDQEENVESTYIRRQQVNDNTLFVNQLLSQLYFNKFDVNLGLSCNTNNSYEPDRRTNTFVHDKADDTYLTATGNSSYNNRFYSKLKGKDITAKAVMGYDLASEDSEKNNKIDLGINYQDNQLDFDAEQYNHNVDRQTVIDKDNPDAFFNQNNLDNDTFNLIPLLQTYNGQRKTTSGLVDYTYDLSPKLTLYAGLRGENIKQNVDWNTIVSSSEFSDAGTIDKNYLLPSINLRYKLKEKNIFRFSASETYILPQFKEVAPFQYDGPNFSSIGNPNLKESDVYNVDVKWDYYLSNDEIISLTGFYKYIKNPINRVYVASAAYTLSYINPGKKANVAGIEAEFRKKIFENASADIEKSSSLYFGLNASYLYSEQNLTDKSAAFTNDRDALQGASPFLVNTDLTYNLKNREKKLTGALVFNYFSDRIYSLGSQNNENITENGVPTLDFVLSNQFNKHLTLGLKARNLLNPHYKLTQGIQDYSNVTIESFKKGMDISLGLNYKF